VSRLTIIRTGTELIFRPKTDKKNTSKSPEELSEITFNTELTETTFDTEFTETTFETTSVEIESQSER